MNSEAAGQVLSTLNSGTTVPEDANYAFYQGTSMAAPHVAALAGLAYVLKSDITPHEVETLMKSYARSFVAGCNQCDAGLAGAGMADAELFLANLGVVVPPPVEPDPVPEAPFAFTATADNANVTLTWFDSSWATHYELEIQKKNRKRWAGYSSVTTDIAQGVGEFGHVPGDGTFRYRLRAVNDTGASDWVESDTVSVSSSGGDSGGGGDVKCHPKRGCPQ